MAQPMEQFYEDLDGGTSSVASATINLIAIMLGIGILSMPYAIAEGGWIGMSILIVLAFICCYTAFALSWCMKGDPNALDYQDIGYRAFGIKGRIITSIFIYFEVVLVAIGYTVIVVDTLGLIFPGHLGHMTIAKIITIVLALVVLPTLWVKDLSNISILSWGGVVISVLVVCSLAWAGVFGGVGFHSSVPIVSFSNLPKCIGLYAFMFAGHVVFPSIYSSMQQPSQFKKVAIPSFCVLTLVNCGVGCMGATMFGSSAKDSVVLNMPKEQLVTKIALWAIVTIPVSKYALLLSPVARELEDLIAARWNRGKRRVARMAITSAILLVVVVSALAVPYFRIIISFTGLITCIAISIIMPCIFLIKIRGDSMSGLSKGFNFGLATLGLALAIVCCIFTAKK